MKEFPHMNALAGWENFYVIVGSSAGALIGLQFVVITLIANRPVVAGQELGANAFATPTIVQFSSVLLLSGIACAPWHTIAGPCVLWGVLGLSGFIYQIAVLRRIRKQSIYKPQFEDWMFHVVLPFAAFGTLAASAYATRADAYVALFGIAAAALLLLFIGIHNAWDAVTYHIFFVRKRPESGTSPQPRKEQN